MGYHGWRLKSNKTLCQVDREELAHFWAILQKLSLEAMKKVYDVFAKDLLE